jgi:heme/copper-type cytochrome/quinol oxidase subunit 3
MEKSISLSASQRTTVSSGMLAMIFFLAAEIMFFAGLISAYIVNRSVAEAMPSIQQTRLPVEMTALNTLFLLISGVTIFLFSKKFKEENRSRLLLILTIAFGSVFLFLQGTEWLKLLSIGFSTSTNIFGAFFYTIIGAHAVHVIVGLMVLIYLFFSLKQGSSTESSKNKIAVCSLYWYFVVGIWPVLYVMVYLS